MNGRRGFTLVELIVTISLISILSSMVIINSGAIARYKEKQDFKNQVHAVYHLFVEEKQQGILDGRRRQAYIFGDKIYFQTLSPSGTKTERIDFNNGMRVVTNTYFGSTLVFNPVGTVNKGGQITFQSKGGDKLTIVVQIGAGRIYLKEGGT
jgi:prepilin-type N-terminal cleavage/methylation domain-containing protein